MLPNMPTCVDAAIISKMGERGQIKGALIEGPLALDTAIDKSAAIKKLKSEVAGDADCHLFPNIETGNVSILGKNRQSASPRRTRSSALMATPLSIAVIECKRTTL